MAIAVAGSPLAPSPPSARARRGSSRLVSVAVTRISSSLPRLSGGAARRLDGGHGDRGRAGGDPEAGSGGDAEVAGAGQRLPRCGAALDGRGRAGRDGDGEAVARRGHAQRVARAERNGGGAGVGGALAAARPGGGRGADSDDEAAESDGVEADRQEARAERPGRVLGRRPRAGPRGVVGGDRGGDGERDQRDGEGEAGGDGEDEAGAVPLADPGAEVADGDDAGAEGGDDLDGGDRMWWRERWRGRRHGGPPGQGGAMAVPQHGHRTHRADAARPRRPDPGRAHGEQLEP
jgi:hypothetical protein